MIYYLCYTVIRSETFIPIQIYLLSHPFHAFSVLKLYKFLIWPTFLAHNREIWVSNCLDNDTLSLFYCHSMWNIHTNPNISTFSCIFCAKTIQILNLTPNLGPKEGNLGQQLSWQWYIIFVIRHSMWNIHTNPNISTFSPFLRIFVLKI